MQENQTELSAAISNILGAMLSCPDNMAYKDAFRAYYILFELNQILHPPFAMP